MSHEAIKVWSAAPQALDRPALTIVARSMSVARRALNATLPLEMIHDPALDILLAMYLADGPQPIEVVIAQISVTNSVTRRWIMALEKAGLVTVENDNVTLSNSGQDRMTATLRNVAQSQWQFGHEI